MMIGVLENCPYCGGVVAATMDYTYGTTGYKVGCTSCDWSTGTYSTLELAKEAWNGMCERVKKIMGNDQSIKADAGKRQIHFVPPQIIYDVAEVREYGVKKYGASESWREVEVTRYIDALGRHFCEFLKDPYGKDAESGIEHYKHMACNLAFLCELLKRDAQEDAEWEEVLDREGD